MSATHLFTDHFFRKYECENEAHNSRTRLTTRERGAQLENEVHNSRTRLTTRERGAQLENEAHNSRTRLTHLVRDVDFEAAVLRLAPVALVERALVAQHAQVHERAVTRLVRFVQPRQVFHCEIGRARLVVVLTDAC